jgi:nicotinate-nucleotide adenylyltransferase
MGGSFNPAHDGHLHIAGQAIRRLGLDQVWWLVSPQNPLKSADGMAGLAERLASARKVGRHPGIVPTVIETALGTRYTVDTVRALKARFPNTKFVWIMGSDNLIQLPRWRAWTRLLRMVPVAILPRAAYSLRALGGKAARRFARHRVGPGRARGLAGMIPPAWTALGGPLHPGSATEIRRRSQG